MPENGTHQKTNIWKEVATQLSDHVDLASLELQYETERAGKKLLAACLILVLALTGLIVLQVALIGALMKTGLSLGLSALVFSSLYFLLAWLAYLKFARRDRRVGTPFSGTQRELRQTIQWIQKILS